MPNMAKISIIVPLYNTEKYIKRCLDSLRSQTYKNIEIIVVNDGSTDDSLRLAEDAAAADSRIKVISHEKNRGLYHARITGVENATGDYIGFTDSDDYVSCDYFRAMLCRAAETGADIVFGKIVHENPSGYRYFHNLYHYYDIGEMDGETAFREFWRQEGRCFAWHTVWNKLYTAELWRKALHILKTQEKRLVMAEDFVFSSMLFSFANKAAATEYGCCFYYQHDGASTSSAGDRGKFERNLADLKTSFDFVEEFVKSSDCRGDVSENFRNWRRLYRHFWEDNIAPFSGNDRKVLEKCLNDAFPCDSDVKYPGWFYAVTTEFDSRYNDISDMIASEEIKCVSFDIFDTAILRPFYRPTDLFYTLDGMFSKICPEEIRSFHDIRVKAESVARAEKQGGEEVTLSDIYESFRRITGISSENSDRLSKAERAAELRFCKPRKSCLNLFNLAKCCGKKIFFTSDMYLDRDFLAEMLRKCGYDGFEDILVSCCEKSTKCQGGLFDTLIKRAAVSPENIMHIGDNWGSDVVSAREHGLKAVFFPKPVNCLQYDISDIKTTHSCCPYTEPSHSMVNLEKGINFLGTRTALAVAANHIYDNPFISFNEWSEMNCSPEFFGYYALGMHLLGFTKWICEKSSELSVDRLLFVARDGSLPMEAYKILRRYFPNSPDFSYLYTSRKAALAAGIVRKEDIFSVWDCINGDVCTPDMLAGLLAPVLDGYDSRILAKSGISHDKPIVNYSRFCRLAEIFGENFFAPEKAAAYRKAVSEYLSGQMDGHCACVDVGYSGRTQELLYRLTGKSADAFYIHTNGGECPEKQRRYGFDVHCFYEFTPSVTGSVRELMFSEYAPSCVGYKVGEKGAEPLFEEFSAEYPRAYMTERLRENALRFISDFCADFGEFMDIMDIRNFDVSYPYEYFLHNLTDADSHMFDCFEFEDDMWAGGSFTLTEYWKNAISYHGTVPFFKVGNNPANQEEYVSGDKAYRLYVQSGMEHKSLFRKALFWLAVDKDFFKKRLIDHLKK